MWYNNEKCPGILRETPELFENCVAYYDFRNNHCNLINGEKATVHGATLTTDHLGNPNSAYSFDGVDDGIDLGISNFSSYTDILFICSCMPNDATGIHFVAGNDLGLRILTRDNKFYADTRTTGNTYINIEDTDTFNIGQRYIVAVTLSLNGNLKLWVNGIEKASVAVTNKENADTYGVWIGNNNRGTRLYFNGVIDFFGFFNLALNSENIKLLGNIISKKYIYPFPKYTPLSLPKPILHYDGTINGNQVIDQSGNGNHGTANNITTGKVGQHKYIYFNNSKITLSSILTGIKTFSFWFQIDNGNTGILIGEANNKYSFQLHSESNIVYFNLGSGNKTINYNFNYDWTYMTATCDGNKIKLYVNGAFVGEVNETNYISIKDFGTYAGGYYLKSKIANMKAYDKVLTPEQILQDYYGSKI